MGYFWLLWNCRTGKVCVKCQPIKQDLKLLGVLYSFTWLCQQSSWNQNTSVVQRPPVHLWWQLYLNLLEAFLSHFDGCLAWVICLDVFFFLTFRKKRFFKFYTMCFQFYLMWDPMSAKKCKGPPLLQIILKLFPKSPEFSSWCLLDPELN